MLLERKEGYRNERRGVEVVEGWVQRYYGIAF